MPSASPSIDATFSARIASGTAGRDERDEAERQTHGQGARHHRQHRRPRRAEGEREQDQRQRQRAPLGARRVVGAGAPDVVVDRALAGEAQPELRRALPEPCLERAIDDSQRRHQPVDALHAGIEAHHHERCRRPRRRRAGRRGRGTRVSGARRAPGRSSATVSSRSARPSGRSGPGAPAITTSALVANGDAKRRSSASSTAADSDPRMPACTSSRSGARSAWGRRPAAAASQASATSARLPPPARASSTRPMLPRARGRRAVPCASRRGRTHRGGAGGRSFQLRIAFQTSRKSDSVW